MSRGGGGGVRPWKLIVSYLPAVNFITIHYAYFIFTILLATVILWGSATPARDLRFIDALFLATSAMTLAGLNTINLSILNTFQQIVLWLLIIMGSAIFVSAFVVHFRRRIFERRFEDIVREHRARRGRRRSSTWTARPLSRSRSRDQVIGADRGSRTASTHFDDTAPASRHAAVDFTLPDTEKRQSHSQDSTELPSSDPDPDPPVPSNPLAPVTTDSPQHNLVAEGSSPAGRQARIAFSPNTVFPATSLGDRSLRSPQKLRHGSSFMSLRGVGVHPNARLRASRSSEFARANTNSSGGHQEHTQSRHSVPLRLVSRNSGFHGLNDADRQHLGGVEYRALIFLSWLVPAYFVLWQLLSCISLGAWVAHDRPERTLRNGINPWWLGAFNAVSAFNNSGMSVLDANMTVFQDAYYMLITMSLLILAGNTCYPIFLRVIIWTLWKLTPERDTWAEARLTLRFLLDHPRRCYTNLFNSRHTWWLLTSVVILNVIDWIAFEVLNIGNEALTSLLPVNLRIIDGLFQAFAVRSGGFYVVPIPIVRISLQVLYVVMMYISVYPVVITMRHSNVYEERSLGIYAKDPDYDNDPLALRRTATTWSKISGLGKHVSNIQESKSYFVRQQIRAQLAHDIWWLVLAVFLIMIIEGSQFERDPKTFSVFNVIFETVSAYGTVGISLGVPYDSYSFCGAWSTLSKLILYVVMLRGRHRGLPVAIDRAVVLPRENLEDVEEEDAMIRMEHSASRSRMETGLSSRASLVDDV
ncbi:hypothetical protein KVT40_008175 [Elsinoe batatas]|uniref:Potassium transport protein n=1 Tax=Elsinoe batatas TaxID=2601811 RepID=A0A8K0KUV8_9PEZI|nr:hypothetical protein KVT40_008175 [Elsinoe batatas]